MPNATDRVRIAVLHHARSFFPLDLVERVKDTAEIIWVLDDAYLGDTATHRLLRKLGTVADIAGLADDDAASLIETSAPDGILAFVDDQIPRAAALAQRLGLRYHTPKLARVLTDKLAQREALAEGGIEIPGFWRIPVHPTQRELEELAAQVTYPAVVKPVSGMGSRGIGLVRDRNALLSLAGAEGDQVLEEYMFDTDDHPVWAASYLSVETVVIDGAPHHLAITGRFPLAEPFRETGNFIPALTDERLNAQLFTLVDRVVATLDVRDSVLHTEIKLTPTGPRIIEINGRLGGRPGFVLSEVSDVNLHAVACLVAAGRPVALVAPTPVVGVGFWLMVQPPIDANTLVAIDGLDEVREISGVRVVTPRKAAGQPVDWRDGSDSQVLTVRGATADHESLGALLADVQAKLQFAWA